MIGIFYSEDVLQEWFLEKLPIARAVLSKYPLFDALFENFKNYEGKRYREAKNMVLHLCLPTVGSEDPDKESIIRLHTLEEALKEFNVMNLEKCKRENFLSKLTSCDYIQSLSAVTELEIAYQMVDKFGKSSVDIFPELSNGKVSDVLLRYDGEEIYFEVGNLGESLPQSKIQEILTSAAKHLGEKTEKMGYIGMFVDTANFVFDKSGRLDVSESLNKLKSEIDILALDKLVGYEGIISLKNFAWSANNRELLERIRGSIPSFAPDQTKLLEDPNVQRWLACFDNTALGKIELIVSLIYGGLRKSGTLIEVKTRDFFPSKATIADRDSFLNHIVRHVEYQLDEGQIETGKPNIILIRGFHWVVFGMGISLESMRALKDKLEEFLDKRRERNLSGVAVFGNNFKEIYFIENPLVEDDSKIEKEEISKLGFRWLED